MDGKTARMTWCMFEWGKLNVTAMFKGRLSGVDEKQEKKNVKTLRPHDHISKLIKFNIRQFASQPAKYRLCEWWGGENKIRIEDCPEEYPDFFFGTPAILW